MLPEIDLWTVPDYPLVWTKSQGRSPLAITPASVRYILHPLEHLSRNILRFLMRTNWHDTGSEDTEASLARSHPPG